MDRIKSIKEKLDSNSIIHKGSTNSEIEKTEQILGVKFPVEYREFLKLFGEDSGELFCGHVVETRYLKDIQKQGRASYLKAIGKKCDDDMFLFLNIMVILTITLNWMKAPILICTF